MLGLELNHVNKRGHSCCLQVGIHSMLTKKPWVVDLSRKLCYGFITSWKYNHSRITIVVADGLAPIWRLEVYNHRDDVDQLEYIRSSQHNPRRRFLSSIISKMIRHKENQQKETKSINSEDGQDANITNLNDRQFPSNVTKWMVRISICAKQIKKAKFQICKFI